MTVKFAPSLLSADFARLGEHVKEAADAGADILHLDIMDGHFVPNITFGPLVIKAIRPLTSVPFNAHLMICEPSRYIEAFAEAGADRILVHPEVCPHLHRVLQQIQDVGKSPGVALNPSTSLDCIEYVMDQIDEILIMTVNPGFGGQKFIDSMLSKISDAAAMIRLSKRQIDLGVDGGINTNTAPAVVRSGANVLIAGSMVFDGPGTVEENLNRLIESVAGVSALV